jgi:hypothetical protein
MRRRTNLFFSVFTGWITATCVSLGAWGFGDITYLLFFCTAQSEPGSQSDPIIERWAVLH